MSGIYIYHMESFKEFAKSRVDELLEILAERNRNEINEFMANVQEAYQKKGEETGRSPDPHQIHAASSRVTDWSTASLSDLPVDWQPERKGKAFAAGFGGRLFPTERLLNLYKQEAWAIELLKAKKVLVAESGAKIWRHSDMEIYCLQYVAPEGNSHAFGFERLGEFLEKESGWKVKEEEERWKPKMGEEYWWFNEEGVGYSNWSDSESEKFGWDYGNVVKTKEQAEEARLKVKQLLTGKP